MFLKYYNQQEIIKLKNWHFKTLSEQFVNITRNFEKRLNQN